MSETLDLPKGRSVSILLENGRSSIGLYRNGLILVSRILDGNQLWGLPSGYVDPGENLVDVVYRKVKKQTNFHESRLTVDPKPVLTIQTIGDKNITETTLFTGHLLESTRSNAYRPINSPVFEVRPFSVLEIIELLKQPENILNSKISTNQLYWALWNKIKVDLADRPESDRLVTARQQNIPDTILNLKGTLIKQVIS